MNYVGIDPGQGGGVATFDDAMRLQVFKLKGLNEKEIRNLLVSLTQEPCVVTIEKVWGLPGCAGQFPFGEGFGVLKGILLGAFIDFQEVAPQTWMRGIGMAGLGMEVKDRKNFLKDKAGRLFPGVKQTLATSDATLIAFYGYKKT